MTEGWVDTTLGEVAAIQMGQSPPGSTYNTKGEGLPFLQGSAEFGDHTPTPVKWCSAPAKVAEEGDLLVSVRAPVGDTNFANQRIAIGRGLAVVRANPNALTPFLRLVIQQKTQELIAASGSGMFSSITANNFRSFRFLLPPLAVQRRIVDLLAHLDNHLANLQTEREAAEAFISGAVDRAVGSILEESTLVPLQSVLQMKPTYGVVKPGQDPVDGILLVRSGDISPGKVNTVSLRRITSDLNEEYRRSQIRRGDVLVALVGNPGAVAVAPDELEGHNIARQVGLLRCADGVQPLFLELLLASTFGRHQLTASIKGAVQKVINLGDLAQIRLPIPELPDQREHLDWYQTSKAWISNLDEEIATASRLRSQVLESLLSGSTSISSTYDLLIPEVA